jgi:hypothetical protein
MKPEQLAKLKAEIAQPKYRDMSDAEISEAIRSEPGTVDRTEISGGLIAASIVRAELAGATAGDKQYIQLVCGCDSLPLTDTLKAELGSIFPAGSKTRANIVALMKREASLSDELGFQSPTPSDIADARRKDSDVDNRSK